MKTFIDSDIDKNKKAVDNELEIIRSLEHKNVSTLLDVFYDDKGRLSYTTEISWDFDLSYKIK